ncbi:MAG: hypothetical protein OEX12_14985 [Gammaproteobacteria bacterium]|nr:hypothetical protein [Gammaproteobacteria bacterium]
MKNKLRNENLDFVLSLATAQMKVGIRESGNSVGTLSNTYMDMVQDVGELKALLESADNKSLSQDTRSAAVDICDRFLERTIAGTIGFQFYDQLSQRLNNVSITLQDVKAVVATPDQEPTQVEWDNLRASIRQRYTNAKDHILLEKLEQGEDISSAVSAALQHQVDDIDLF